MSEEVKSKKLVVIDGKSVFYRGYYAMPNLSTKEGQPTGGVFGFATMALEVIRRLKPDYVAVAWDKPKTNIRRRLEMYPEYKAGRKPAPPDFYVQVEILLKLLKAFGWPLYELDDYEADDIMGTLAVQAREKGIETVLITSDLDMLQLVNDKVHVYALKTGLSNIELYSPKSFEAKYGIGVDQFLDLKALKGDSSDNIPGVPGIGEKGAIELLKQYDTLDGVYENLELIKESLKKKLVAGKDLAYLSKRLAQIWTDAPLKLNLDEVDGNNLNPSEVLDMLEKLEFRSLARQLPEVMQVKINSHKRAIGDRPTTFGNNSLIKTVKQLDELNVEADIAYIAARSAGKHGARPETLVISLDGSNTYSLDLTVLDPKDVVKTLSGIKSLVGYDVKSSLKVLLELGTSTLPAVNHDVMIADFLLNPLRRDQSITTILKAETDYEGSDFDNLDQAEFISRAAEIVAYIKVLADKQVKELAKYPKLYDLAKSVEWPVIPVLAKMEYIGIELDVDYLKKFSDEITDLISDYEQQIYGHANKEFNIASPMQLAEVLFIDLKLPTGGIKKGKTGYSTGASELDKLRGTHPIIDLITQYREVAKLKNTYVDTLPTMVDTSSRLHTTFNLTIAQTGRLSSTDPNLQNIPIRTELGRRIRTAFVAAPNKKLISADYSQFELRIAAVLADDTELIEMFNRGADIHTSTAAQVYDRQPEDVTKQMRRAAKVINFGILYGMSPHGLSIATGMTRDQAAVFIDKYKEVRKPIFDYIETLRQKTRDLGYAESLLGRRRPSPDIHSPNFAVRNAAERAAINMPIQGTEADLMKLAMVKIDDLLTSQHNDCNQLLQIHDSILVECPSDVATSLGDKIKDVMEGVYKLPVRLDVDISIGDNWGQL